MTFTVSGMVSPSATGQLSNTATAIPSGAVTNTDPSADGSGQVAATVVDTVLSMTSLTATVTDNSASVQAGTQTAYSIDVHVDGPADAHDVTVTSTATPSLTDVQTTGPGTYDATTSTFSVSTLAAGSDSLFLVHGTVPASTTAATLIELVNVAASNAAGTAALDVDTISAPTTTLTISNNSVGGHTATTVTSNPSGISCTATCATTSISGSQLVLSAPVPNALKLATAAAYLGNSFGGPGPFFPDWGGPVLPTWTGCSSTGYDSVANAWTCTTTPGSTVSFDLGPVTDAVKAYIRSAAATFEGAVIGYWNVHQLLPATQAAAGVVSPVACAGVSSIAMGANGVITVTMTALGGGGTAVFLPSVPLSGPPTFPDTNVSGTLQLFP